MVAIPIRAKSLALRSTLRLSLGLHKRMGRAKHGGEKRGRYGQVPETIRQPDESFELKLREITMRGLVWDGPGPTLVAVHGLNNNAWAWSRMATLLHGKVRVVSISQRGHGGSTAPKRGYTLEQTTGDLLEAMDKLHLDKVHIIGHSWGGKVVNHAIATVPRRFLSAVLADPAPPQGMNLLIRGLPWVAEATLRAERGPFPDEASWWKAGPNLAYLQHWNEADQNIWKTSFRRLPDGSYEHVLPESGFREIMHETIQQDITDMLERITCPVLLIRPTLTVSFLPGEFRQMRKRVARFEERRIQGDHTFIHTNPYDTADLVLEHIQRAERG